RWGAPVERTRHRAKGDADAAVRREPDAGVLVETVFVEIGQRLAREAQRAVDRGVELAAVGHHALIGRFAVYVISAAAGQAGGVAELVQEGARLLVGGTAVVKGDAIGLQNRRKASE